MMSPGSSPKRGHQAGNTALESSLRMSVSSVDILDPAKLLKTNALNPRAIGVPVQR